MRIPIEQLSAATLEALVEEFVTRDGTDYGETEAPLASKKQQVMSQLRGGEVIVVFDADSETANLMRAEDYQPE